MNGCMMVMDPVLSVDVLMVDGQWLWRLWKVVYNRRAKETN